MPLGGVQLMGIGGRNKLPYFGSKRGQVVLREMIEGGNSAKELVSCGAASQFSFAEFLTTVVFQMSRAHGRDERGRGWMILQRTAQLSKFDGDLYHDGDLPVNRLEVLEKNCLKSNGQECLPSDCGP